MTTNSWMQRVEILARSFARKHANVYAKTKREIYATFEVGCYLSLLRRYEKSGFTCVIQNTRSNTFRFLTTPSGNPDNFSFVTISDGHEKADVRQQVRVRSYLDPDIAFTPDILVLRPGTNIEAKRDQDYANGRTRFFCVSSVDVLAAHECKSTEPFPELFISFIGMLVAAHAWMEKDADIPPPSGKHLAPTLFIGGTARPLHRRMIKALTRVYPLNVVQGLHHGTWALDSSELKFISPSDRASERETEDE